MAKETAHDDPSQPQVVAQTPATQPAAPNDPELPAPPVTSDADDPMSAKNIVKSKTFITGMLVSLLGFLGFVQAIPQVANNAMLSSLLLMAVGIVMIILRMVTKQPVQPVFNIPHMGGQPLPPLPQPFPHEPTIPDDNSGSSWDGWRDDPQTKTAR